MDVFLFVSRPKGLPYDVVEEFMDQGEKMEIVGQSFSRANATVGQSFSFAITKGE